jgi:hypothetical protein
MATGDRRNTALFGAMAPDQFVGITPVAGRVGLESSFPGTAGLYGRTNRGVSLFATRSAPEGAIGVGVPWRPVLLPTAPHPKFAAGGPALKYPLLLANPRRSIAPQPKPGISYTFDFGSIDLGAGR